MRIYNTLGKKKETFKPRKGKKINMFVCGPTVYDLSHIGHARTYVAFDIRRANRDKKDPLKLSDKFTKEFYKDMKALKISSVSKYAKASDHIKDILSQTKRLLKKDQAYELSDGLYFDLSSFKDYGKLSGRTHLKEDDSVTKIDEALPVWKTELGEGRPGWHIEDTAITEHFFGPQYDIHGGGLDLIFPHHENEIAIMESISRKKPLVKYWMHTGFLNVEGKKMAKSLGNFITIRDALKKYSADVLRLMFVSTHYKSPIDYSEKSIKQAKANLERIRTAIPSGKKKADNKKWIKKFEAIMNDDLNTPKVIALLLEMARRMNKGENLSSAVYKIGTILGVDFKPQKAKVPLAIKKLVQDREKARKAKDWKKADKIRTQLKKKGWLLEDSAKGAKVKRI
jgi:cysteinyl-tRNA synthetase